MAQMVEGLPSKHEALSSNSSTKKERKEGEREEGRKGGREEERKERGREEEERKEERAREKGRKERRKEGRKEGKEGRERKFKQNELTFFAIGHSGSSHSLMYKEPSGPHTASIAIFFHS
jgi:hypothetical protein